MRSGAHPAATEGFAFAFRFVFAFRLPAPGVDTPRRQQFASACQRLICDDRTADHAPNLLDAPGLVELLDGGHRTRAANRLVDVEVGRGARSNLGKVCDAEHLEPGTEPTQSR